jgi:hypothetical protein
MTEDGIGVPLRRREDRRFPDLHEDQAYCTEHKH